MDSLVTGEEPYEIEPLEIRLGIPKSHFFEDLGPEIERAVWEAVRKLRDAGV